MSHIIKYSFVRPGVGVVTLFNMVRGKVGEEDALERWTGECR